MNQPRLTDSWRLLYECVQVAHETLERFIAQSHSQNDADVVDWASYLAAFNCAVAEADASDSVGLQDIFQLFQAEVECVCEPSVTTNFPLLEIQKQALEKIQAYLLSPADADVVKALLAHFQAPEWHVALEDDDVEMYEELLLIRSDNVASSDNFSAEDDDTVVIRPEILSLLKQEVTTFFQNISTTIDTARAHPNDDNVWPLAFSCCAEELESFSAAAAAVGMEGLSEVCFYLVENFNALAKQNDAPSAEVDGLLDACSHQLEHYLDNVNDVSVCEALGQYLSDSAWPSPLPVDDIAAIVEILSSIEIDDEPLLVASRQTLAKQSDVSLELPQDVNQDLLDALLQELPVQTSDLSSSVKKMLAGEGGLEDVKVALRVAHSLKGAGNTVGIRGIANLTHHLEDILQAFFEHSLLPQGDLIDVLMDAADCLEVMSEALLGLGDAPDYALEVLQSILDWANAIDREGLDASDIAQVVVVKNTVKESDAEQASVAVSEPKKASFSGATVRVPVEFMDELLRLGGEGIIVNGQVQNRVKGMRVQAAAMREKYRVVQQLTYELEQLVSVRDVLAINAGAVQVQSSAAEMEQYNELHSCLSRLEEAVADSREFAEQIHDDLYVMEDLVVEQNRLQKDNQDAIYRSRMVPVSTIIPRCERGVRQACRLTDKSVDLRIEGSDTMMDSQVLSDFVEPLMHLLRNAVDHGVESAERRRALGKNETGSIALRFARVGDLIEVICEDDGAGLNSDKIEQMALAKGMMTQAEELTEAEINQFILLPGFTTKGEATQVSGRGVGMDAVYAKIKEMKGGLSLHSEKGVGLKVVLHLPVSMLSVSARLVRCGDTLVAVSNYGVDAMLKVTEGELRETDDGLVFMFDGEAIAAICLATLMGRRAQTSEQRSVFLVQSDVGPRRAVLVDEVLLSTDMVVKSTGAYMPQIVGVVGVTILGDGSVASVLDVPELLRSEKHGLVLSQPVLEESPRASGYALVVDDSLSARRALSGFMGDCGFDVKTAIDGIAALDIIKERVPDILLVDMEMPRMNGIELTRCLRADAETRDIPIIMITSRSTAKHRAEADDVGVSVYLIKPFDEVELQDHINALLI